MFCRINKWPQLGLRIFLVYAVMSVSVTQSRMQGRTREKRTKMSTIMEVKKRQRKKK